MITKIANIRKIIVCVKFVWCDLINIAFRITSYNVCYTKLLRVSGLLDLLERAVSICPAYELGFKPDSDVVDLIRSHFGK